MVGHTFGARQVTLPGTSRPHWFIGRINMLQHSSCYFRPISTFGVSVEQAQIGDEMFVVIIRQIARLEA
jgi:hypothetical protein